jgi:large subunit ribosomal protein L4
MRSKALYTILSQKLRDGEILFVDSISLTRSKTKFAIQSLQSLSSVKGFEKIFSKKNNATIIALSSKNKETERAFDNLGNIETLEARNLNPLALLEYKYLIIENPQKSFAVLPGLSKIES